MARCSLVAQAFADTWPYGWVIMVIWWSPATHTVSVDMHTACPGSAICWCQRSKSTSQYHDPSRRQGRHVNDEAVTDVTPEDTFIGFVNILDVNRLDFADNVVAATEIEHFLGFAD